MLDENFNCVLTDFGLSTSTKDGRKAIRCKSRVGTEE